VHPPFVREERDGRARLRQRRGGLELRGPGGAEQRRVVAAAGQVGDVPGCGFLLGGVTRPGQAPRSGEPRPQVVLGLEAPVGLHAQRVEQEVRLGLVQARVAGAHPGEAVGRGAVAGPVSLDHGDVGAVLR
jgi:hypothetical protein